jgi:hypothetical protein
MKINLFDLSDIPKKVLSLLHQTTTNNLKLKAMTTLTTDQKINNLKAGEEIIISSANGITCHAERTGNGKLIKYVRTFADGSFEVYNTVRFNS